MELTFCILCCLTFFLFCLLQLLLLIFYCFVVGSVSDWVLGVTIFCFFYIFFKVFYFKISSQTFVWKRLRANVAYIEHSKYRGHYDSS